MPSLDIPAVLEPLLRPKRYKIIIGGRGSGKSKTATKLCLKDAQVHELKTACFREFQNSIEDSMYSSIAGEIEGMGLQGFDVQSNKILYNGHDSFKFKGLARNISSIQSMDDFDRFLVDEAQTISNKSLKVLTPTLRSDNSEIWMIGNPMSSADPFSQRFIVPFQSQLDKHGYYEDDLHMIIVCNYTDNPFFPQVLEDDRKYDYLNLDRAEYDWIWLGKYNDSVANSIIKPEWFDAAIDAHVELGFKAKGATIIAHDPSDIGDDDKGLAVRKGSVILDVQCKEDGDVNEGCDWATNIAIDLKADMFVWDCDGLGVSLNRQVSEAFDGIKCDITQFKGSWSPANKDSVYDRSDSIREPKTNGETFKNRRSQYYWMLRDRFYKTYQAVEKGAYIDPDELISLSSSIKDMQALRSEVCRIPLKQNGNGVIQLMTKLEMSKEGIASPNMADSLMMCMEVPKIKKKWAKLNYQPTGIV